MRVKVLTTDRNLIPTGDPIAAWTSLDVTAQFNAAGAGEAVMPARPEILEQLTGDGARMVVYLDGAYFLGGPIEGLKLQRDASGQGDLASPGQVTVSFSDDFALLASMVTYPDPAHASTAQGIGIATYTVTGVNAETVLRDLVDLNGGPGSIADRQIPHLSLATAVGGIGSSINLSTRFEPLGDVLRRAAIAGGGLGFRTYQQGTDILFEVYNPTDLSGLVRFSWGLRNLQELTFDHRAPTATVAIIGGDGTGSSRAIRERTNPAAIARWWRAEEWVNAFDTSDTTEMDQSGDQALADGGEQAQLDTTVLSNDDQVYGQAYRLGDVVSVEVYQGFVITDIVRAANLKATPDNGAVVMPLIGPESTTTDTRAQKQNRQFDRRLGNVERS